MGSFTNAGLIAGGEGGSGYSSQNGTGVYIAGPVGHFTNTGTIRGGIGVSLDDNTGTTLSNGGLIELTYIGGNGTQDGLAVRFGDGADTLELLTGGHFIGDVNFGDGINTFDFSSYHGSMVLAYYGALDPTTGLKPGSNLFVQQDPNGGTPGLVVIVGDASERFNYVPVTDLVSGLSDLLQQQLAGLGLPGNGVTQQAIHKPAPADVKSAAADTGRHVWAQAIGGGSLISGADGVHNVFGALAVGTDVEVSKDMQAGILGGYARTQMNIANGTQTVTGNTVFAGAYARTEMSTVELDFQVLAGMSMNSSSRTIQTQSGTDTATAEFNGWFVAPEVTAAVPVLKLDKGELKVVGKLGYIGGGFGGYTETGSQYAATVGAQMINVLTAYAGLSDDMVLGMTPSGTIKGQASVGVFSQTNLGGGTVPVAVYGLDTGGSAIPTGTTFGLKAGFSVDMPISDSAKVSAGANAAVSGAGQFSGSANVKISGQDLISIGA